MSLAVEGLTALLQVYDMPRALQFYRDGLGFTVINSSGAGDDCGWVMLQLDQVKIMLNTAYDHDERPAAPDPARAAAHADTILYFDCRDLDACYAHLIAMGAPAQAPKTAYYGMRQVLTSDPDGYALCFQWPVSQPHSV